jgi:hypothetical protein
MSFGHSSVRSLDIEKDQSGIAFLRGSDASRDKPCFCPVSSRVYEFAEDNTYFFPRQFRGPTENGCNALLMSEA